jgi:arginine exporter protein ArgO
MKNFLGYASVLATISLVGDVFAKEMNQNQLISVAGAGIITSIWFFILRFEELMTHYFKEKS